MAMNVEIVRKEMIKPSSPTPHHLKEHKLSFLDQVVPSVYLSLIIFYEANQIHGQKETYCQLLKRSLSMALTHYYPLAGRVRDNYIVDCNDVGALFVEARVDADLLQQFIKNPDMDDLKQLLPVDPNGIGNNGEEVILAVQINKMGCGGTAIAVQMSHKVVDGHSLVTFINSWAAISRGNAEIKPPLFDSASIFPPVDSSMNLGGTIVGIIKEKIVSKRLVIGNEKLKILKHIASSGNNGSQVDHPTRVEVVSALIWKLFLEAKKRESGGDKKVLAALHAVNVRPRVNPSLPDHAFGNLCVVSNALHEEGDIGYQGLVSKLRVAIRKVDETFVKSIQNVDEYLKNNGSFREAMSKGEIESCIFSPWSRFPVYEVDYGWGKPVWTTTTTLPFKNCIVILSTKSGDGFDMWINMLEKDASFFEIDHVPNLSA